MGRVARASGRQVAGARLMLAMSVRDCRSKRAAKGAVARWVLLSFNPTRIGGKGAHTVAGVWQVAIEAGTVGVINGWIERDGRWRSRARSASAIPRRTCS